MKNIELEELLTRGYLKRSPLENNPSTAMSNLRTKLGNRVAIEIFEFYEILMRGEEKSCIILKLGQNQVSRYG